MVKENKKMKENTEKQCECDKNCKCGCQEGKECTCDCCHDECKCEHGHCGCPCKRTLGKVLILVLVFFAGFGVSQFMKYTCMGRCPAKGPRMAPMMRAPLVNGNLPTYSDDNGNTIVIVNTGEGSECNCGKCNCSKSPKPCQMKKDMPHMPAPADLPTVK